jgi:hypothetical protein
MPSHKSRVMFVAGVLAQIAAVVGRSQYAQSLQSGALPRVETRQLPAAAALAALGNIYGDIGTSLCACSHGRRR